MGGRNATNRVLMVNQRPVGESPPPLLTLRRESLWRFKAKEMDFDSFRQALGRLPVDTSR